MKEDKTFYPFFLALAFTIFFSLISILMSCETDKIIAKIDNTTQNTYTEVMRLSGQITNIEIGLTETKPIIFTRVVNLPAFYPSGLLILDIAINRPSTIYKKGYVFDIGDSYVKSRMSLYIDENGFLTWKIIDDSFVIHELKYDYNQYLNGEIVHLGLGWNEDGLLIMFVNKDVGSQIKLEQLTLNIQSTELHFGSDLDNEYKIDFSFNS